MLTLSKFPKTTDLEPCNTRFYGNNLKINIRIRLKALNVVELDTLDHVMINLELEQQKLERHL